jgi:hypothetical protein
MMDRVTLKFRTKIPWLTATERSANQKKFLSTSPKAGACLRLQITDFLIASFDDGQSKENPQVRRYETATERYEGYSSPVRQVKGAETPRKEEGKQQWRTGP